MQAFENLTTIRNPNKEGTWTPPLQDEPFRKKHLNKRYKGESWEIKCPSLVYRKDGQFSLSSFSIYTGCWYIGEERDFIKAIKASGKQSGNKHIVQTLYKYKE